MATNLDCCERPPLQQTWTCNVGSDVFTACLTLNIENKTGITNNTGIRYAKLKRAEEQIVNYGYKSKGEYCITTNKGPYKIGEKCVQLQTQPCVFYQRKM